MGAVLCMWRCAVICGWLWWYVVVCGDMHAVVCGASGGMRLVIFCGMWVGVVACIRWCVVVRRSLWVGMVLCGGK